MVQQPPIKWRLPSVKMFKISCKMGENEEPYWVRYNLSEIEAKELCEYYKKFWRIVEVFEYKPVKEK